MGKIARERESGWLVNDCCHGKKKKKCSGESGRMKTVEDGSGSLILGVNYSNFLQLISMRCDSAVTALPPCEP